MFPSGNNDQNRNPSEVKPPKCEDLFAGIPFTCLLLYISLAVFWGVDLFTSIGEVGMANNVYETIFGFQIWRLLTSLFFESSLLMIIFIVLNGQTFLPHLESRKGSTFLIIELITANLKIQLFINIIQYLLVAIFQFKYQGFYSGASSVWFNLMTIFCWINPKQMKFCCFNVKFNRKYYPFVFCFIICLWNFSIKIDLISGLILGLLQSTIFKKIPNLLKIEHYQFIDQLFLKIGVSKFKTWINFKNISSQQICTLNVYQNLEMEENQFLSSDEKIDDRMTNYSSNNNKNVDTFFQGKGVKLSDY